MAAQQLIDNTIVLHFTLKRTIPQRSKDFRNLAIFWRYGKKVHFPFVLLRDLGGKSFFRVGEGALVSQTHYSLRASGFAAGKEFRKKYHQQ
jgi:hypothetical protein